MEIFLSKRRRAPLCRLPEQEGGATLDIVACQSVAEGGEYP